MILLIDNYDSFTYNLYHYLAELGADVVVERNDALTADEAIGLAPQAILLSPGPCTPNEAGICIELVGKAAGKIPLLGVCLGHQAIAQFYGGEIVRAGEVVHGKTSPISHKGSDVFSGLPDPFTATRYHSLIVARDSLPDCLTVTAETADGTIMGLAHKSVPLWGLQFHPESIATEHGHALLANFMRLSGIEPRERAA